MTEQINAFSWLRFNHPELAVIAIHPKNEGKRTWGQVHYDKISGSLSTGAPDLIIPANPPFLCELKREDHTKSKWQEGQLEFLTNASKQGAFVCVALGANGLKKAVGDYLAAQQQEENQNETTCI